MYDRAVTSVRAGIEKMDLWREETKTLEPEVAARFRVNTIEKLQSLIRQIEGGVIVSWGYDHWINVDDTQTFKVEIRKGPNF